MQPPRIEWFRKGTRRPQAIGGFPTALCSGDLWRSVRLETRQRPGPGELPEGHVTTHLLVVNTGAPVELEIAHAGGTARGTSLPGDVHLIPAGLSYSARWGGATDALFVGIAPEAVAAFAGEDIELPLRFSAKDPLAAQLALALLAELRAGSPFAATYGEAIGAALTAHVVRNHATRRALPAPPRGGLPSSRLRAVLSFIDDHLDASISLADLAERAGVSAYHFAHVFKTSTGLPPHHFVVRRRVERAMGLLRGHALAIGEVALRAGFGSASHFAVVFRREVGVTPREYRRRCADAPRDLSAAP